MRDGTRAGLTVLPDEDALVARAQSAPEAFTQLYRHYLPAVYRYCYRRLGSREAAEDATSQVFMHALVALPRYRDGSFRARLFTIAHHVVVDDVRRMRPTAPLDQATLLTDGTWSPEPQVLRSEQHDALLAAIHRLPPSGRSLSYAWPG